MMTEQKAKMATIKNAKKFIDDFKLVINDIAIKLDSNEEGEQIAATINAMVINECLTEYPIKANAIIEDLNKMENKNKLN